MLRACPALPACNSCQTFYKTCMPHTSAAPAFPPTLSPLSFVPELAKEVIVSDVGTGTLTRPAPYKLDKHRMLLLDTDNMSHAVAAALEAERQAIEAVLSWHTDTSPKPCAADKLGGTADLFCKPLAALGQEMQLAELTQAQQQVTCIPDRGGTAS